MKARLIAATIAMCLLYGVSSAQTYAIRVTHNTNLRASYSLESAIIETAPAGTTLQVVGKSGRWLRISRNGNDVWMADWVAYSRVEGGEPTPEQPTSNINNCCFVDRQCQTDQDWTDGYWAFQNNQCGAPPQTGAPTSSQPVSGAPAQIDNCCFVDRQCHSDQDWIDGYRAFQNNQCAHPGNPHPGIEIVGDADFVDYYVQRLDLLKNRLPGRYAYTISGLDRIQQETEGRPGVNVILKTYFEEWRDDGTPGHGTSKIRSSAVLVHEACHVHQYNAGSSVVQCDHEAYTREEVICRQMELEVLIELDAAPDVIEWARGMVARTRKGLRLPGC